MGKINKIKPVKFFTAITYKNDFPIKEIIKSVMQIAGPPDMESALYNFDSFTNYYEIEMGKNLVKRFIAFKNLQNPDKLPELKTATNKIEQQYLSADKRRVNIDPGYLTEAKVVLATTKDYSHRLYLGSGIYGDLHLYYTNKSFQPQDWTYPDYRGKTAVNFFNNLRELYRKQLYE